MKEIKRYKLPGVKQISHRDEKYSIGNTIDKVHNHIPEVTERAARVSVGKPCKQDERRCKSYFHSNLLRGSKHLDLAIYHPRNEILKRFPRDAAGRLQPESYLWCKPKMVFEFTKYNSTPLEHAFLPNALTVSKV